MAGILEKVSDHVATQLRLHPEKRDEFKWLVAEACNENHVVVNHDDELVAYTKQVAVELNRRSQAKRRVGRYKPQPAYSLERAEREFLFEMPHDPVAAIRGR